MGIANGLAKGFKGLSSLTSLLVTLVAGFGIVATVALPIRAEATPVSTLTADQKLSDLNQLVSLIKSGYGPLHYKQARFHLNVDTLRDAYAKKVLATKSNGQFYYTIMQFIAEFHDGHFRASVPTDLKSTVPFDTDLFEGKVLITNIDRSQLPESQFPFQIGDEVTAVDGVPVQKVVDQLQSYRGLGNPLAEKRLAAMEVSFRPGSRMPTPQGDVVFSIRHGTSNVIDNVKMKWQQSGTTIDEELSNFGTAFRFYLPPLEDSRPNYDDISTFGIWRDFSGPRLERSYACSGTTRIAIPKDATIIMKSPFVAYYYKTASGKVLGYLRIPEYDPADGNYDQRFAQTEYAVQVLEKNTDGLIIDQDHNCGGSIELMHRILSLFLTKPAAPLQFQLLANKEEYLNFMGWAKQAGQYTIANSDLMGVANLIKTSWLKGDFMTPKIAIDGNAEVYPNAVHYTKPIVMLIDEMAGSGGDAFPALMGGIGRAKLLGHTTMSLGGNVVPQAPLFYSQIVPDMTKSLFYRPDGVPVENNGAVPDYQYTTTRDDLMYGYRDYRAFYEQKLLALLK